MRPGDIFLFAFCAVTAASGASAQPTIIEYPLPTAASSATWIVKGPDGNLWFTEYATNMVAKITTSGVITEYPIPTPNSGPAGLTVGADGNFWFPEILGNKIAKVAPTGMMTEYPLPTPTSSPSGITSGPDGNIWFIEGIGIGKITPAGVLTEYQSGGVLPGYSQITAGPDGNLWFTEPARDEVGRITPLGAITDFPLLASEPAGYIIRPQAIVLGPDGNLWVGGKSTVWKVTTTGAATPYPFFPNSGAITTGPDGNLWSTGPYGPGANSIVRLTTDGAWATYSVQDPPNGIAAGPDGNIWFTEGNKIGKVVLSTAPIGNPLTLSQTTLTFNAPAYGSAPPAQTLTVTAPTAVQFSVLTSHPFQVGFDWLGASPSGSPIVNAQTGVLSWTTNNTITVSVYPNALQGLTPGTAPAVGSTYFEYILLTIGNVTQTVLVKLNITAPAIGGGIKVQPTALSFSYTTPQGTAPLPQQIFITDANPLSGSIPLTISYTIYSPSGGKWLSLSVGNNSLANGGTGTSPMGLGVQVDPTGLSPGVYTADITIKPTGGAPVPIAVTLTVTANPNPTTISVAPGTLSFVWQQGTVSPPTQSAQLTESGPQLSWAAQSDSPAWLSVTPVAGNPPTMLTVSVVPIALAPGNYTGTITITLPLLAGVSTKITVSLTVLPQSTQPLIQEYPLAPVMPECIAVGSDGNLWFTEHGGNVDRIGRITTSGVVTEYALQRGTSPYGIASGPDGALWFAETGANKIGRITTNGMITEYPVPTPGAGLWEITSGPDGSLWFTEDTGNKIGKITTGGAITEFPVPTSMAGPDSITYGPGAALWFTERNYNRVAKITTTGVIQEFTLEPMNPQIWPVEIAAGPDGNLWVTATNKIWKMTASGSATPFFLTTTNSQPSGITAGLDGNLWFTEDSGNKIVRLSPGGVFTEFALPAAGSHPAYISIGPDTNLWFTESAGNRIGKLVVSAAPAANLLGISQPSLTFTSTRGSSPVPQTLTITAGVSKAFTASANVVGSTSWLTISPSGNLTTGQTITITANPGSLSPGTYQGNVLFTAGSVTQAVPVTLTLTAGNDVAVSPEALNLFYTVGDTNPVSSPDLQISPVQSSSGPIPFTIAAAADSPGENNWLTFTTAFGALISPGTIQTTPLDAHVNVNPSGLAIGTHTATITVTPTGGAAVKVPVTLSIRPLVTISAGPASLHFSSPVGVGAPASQSLQLTSTSGPVQFSLGGTTAGQNWISWSANSQQTPATLTVSVSAAGLTQGTYSTTLTVYPSPLTVPALQVLTIPIDFTVGTAPYITAVVNAASFSLGSPPSTSTSGGLPGAAVAVGEVVTITGSNLGPTSPLGLALDATGKVATSLGGVTVAFDDVYLAPLTYVSDGQINCVVPYEAANQFGTALVTYGGQSNRFVLSKTSVVPGIFTLNGSGTGTVAAVNSTGGYNGPDNPAPQGSTITFYLTGEGQTNPRGVTGNVTTVDTSSGRAITPQPMAGPPTVTIGGQPATVSFYGEAPGMVAGVMQLNVNVPTGLPSGNLPLLVSFGAAPSQNGVTVAIQ